MSGKLASTQQKPDKLGFLNMPKNNRHGKAAILNLRDWKTLERETENDWFDAFLHIAYYTGERWGAICQLKVDDVYANARERNPKSHITFRKETRKGKDKTRQVPVHRHLRAVLTNFEPPPWGYLFPSPRDRAQPISFDTAEKRFRRLLARCGLEGQGYSTHSTRRTLITNLARSAVDLKTIQQITGHNNTNVLMGYIEEDEQRVKAAIANLPG